MSSPPLGAPKGVSSRHGEILSVAADLFWAQGYDATSMSDLAAALGLSKASLYHHIETKESLLFDMSVVVLRRITAAVEAAADSSPEPLERLRAMVREHVVTALDHQTMNATSLTELRALSDEHRVAVTRMRDSYDRMIDEVIAEAQHAGAIRADISSKLLRLALLNLLNWTIFWFRADGDVSPADLADLLTSIFLQGALVASG